MSLPHNQNPRFLGEGNVTKINKNFMFVEDLKYGKIYVRIEAALPNQKQQFGDLRDAFEVGDSVVYTATRQSEKQECMYAACSIIHKHDLKMVEGKVIELCERYAYIEAPRYGRIFAPFSARTDGSRHWNGKSATIGKVVSMKVLPQPELHKCSFVAYAVYNNAVPLLSDTKDDGSNGNKRTEYQPEIVKRQLGVIVLVATDEEDGLIYAQTTGSISFSKSTIFGKYEAGYFVHVDVTKKVSDKFEKCLWRATLIDLIGFLPAVKTDHLQNRFNLNEICVTVDVTAVVCRVSQSNASIWLWNDLIGRIFVNNHHYINDLHAMDVVTVKAQFTAAFEDVPWSAISVRPCTHENSKELRDEFGQLMITDDNWKVLYVCEQTNGGFYGFMEHPTRGPAFMAWTDLNVGETPPVKNTFVRATVYSQHRDTRHPWRALLVTQMDPETKKPSYEHPKYDNTGNFYPSIAQQIRAQKAANQPPPVKNENVWTIPSATVTNPKIIAQHQTSSSNTSIDSGRASSGLITDTLVSPAIEPPPGFPIAPLNTPIGAERLFRALSISNGDTVVRTPSVDHFLFSETTDKLNGLAPLRTDSPDKYFNPWHTPSPFGLTSKSTWEPLTLNSTPTLERRNTMNGFEPIGSANRESSPTTAHNNGLAEALKQKARHDEEQEKYETFLCDEILKRPHLLKKIITTNMEAQRYCLSVMKQQQLNNNSTTI